MFRMVDGLCCATFVVQPLAQRARIVGLASARVIPKRYVQELALSDIPMLTFSGAWAILEVGFAHLFVR